MRLVIDPHPKETNHLKIVISEEGELSMVQLYHDGRGSGRDMIPVYEILKEEITDFGLKARKLISLDRGQVSNV
jgi:hypothetical protein